VGTQPDPKKGLTVKSSLSIDTCLPADAEQAILIGRVWLDGTGPLLVRIMGEGIYDLSHLAATSSELLELFDPVGTLREYGGARIASTAEVLANSAEDARSPSAPWFLAPCDLQAIKAAGVTFVSSMLERVIEEQARGDAGKAQAVREAVVAVIGDNLASIRPGSAEAMKLKDVLIAQGVWSQYLEVGIGPDAEIFTKSQAMSAVGVGAEVGIHPGSVWNNPEPEVVLAVNSRAQAVGAALGNDVNLRDFEGRSALLLGKAKDNNASCSIGPFIRLFDEHFTLADIENATLTLSVSGLDGFEMSGGSNMAEISRKPANLVKQTRNDSHQYPDGFMLFLGTMFAPTQDREKKGSGFTHKAGDLVEISTPLLGTLRNTVVYSDEAAPWTYGTRALMRNLAKRGLL
jgi:fumarylacetoacetate (FAA) hydrolase family protein